MSIHEIERALRELRLSGIAATLNTRVMEAQSSQQPFLETLAAMLQDELDRRHSRLSDRRFKHSRLDERLTLAEFDWRFNPKLPRKACFELHTLKFIGEGCNASFASSHQLRVPPRENLAQSIDRIADKAAALTGNYTGPDI